MYTVIRAGELKPTPLGTIQFDGERFGSGISFFIVNNQPGEGPDLHKHPYTETWIVRSGTARMMVDGKEFEANPGDVAVVGAETPHKFKNIGGARLEIICIHDSPRIVQTELEE